MVAVYSLKSRDTGLLRNSRLMGIPEFRCMANDVEMYRRSKVCSIGTPMKLNGTSAFQEKFYYILSDLLWRVCENYNEISQANFYKLYRWFHVTRKLLKPPPPKPDYVSPFAKKEGPKKPMATIRMYTKKNPVSYDIVEQDTMRSRVDPARYLGSHVSLTDSITSSLQRLGSPQSAKPGDAILLTLSENEKAIDAESGSEGPAVWVAKNENAGKSRTLGTIRQSGRTCQTSEPALSKRLNQPTIGGPTLSQDYLPNISRPQTPSKSRAGVDSEVDADVTIVDADAVLDQGSELMLRLQGSPSHPATPRAATPPLPSVDVLSKRQLKLIGTHATSPNVSCKALNNIDKPLSDLINSDPIISPIPKRSMTAPAPGITPSALFEMAGQVGERMMVNRARLLFLQHNAGHGAEGAGNYHPCSKPPTTAPPGLNRATPLPSVQTFDSKTTSGISSERATTAPIPVSRARITIRRRSSIKSAKFRGPGSASTSQSVPGRSDSRVRETQLSEPFTVRAVTPQAPGKTPQPITPPPTASLVSAESCRFSPDEDDGLAFMPRMSHKERCAKYKDPHQDTIGYLTLEDDDDISLSQTPLLNVSQDGFSSLSSFLPSNTSLVS